MINLVKPLTITEFYFTELIEANFILVNLNFYSIFFKTSTKLSRFQCLTQGLKLDFGLLDYGWTEHGQMGCTKSLNSIYKICYIYFIIYLFISNLINSLKFQIFELNKLLIEFSQNL